MLVEVILFVAGIFLLVKASDFVVDSSVILAKKLGISSLLVGLTVIAFGTSLPELVISLFSSFESVGEIAMGNILGSNIANVLLVLGASAILAKKIKIKKNLIWEQIPFALLAAFVLFVMETDLFGTRKGAFLGRSDGLILLSFFGVYLYFMVKMIKNQKGSFQLFDITKDKGTLELVSRMIFGFIALFVAGRWIIDSTVVIAKQLGVNEFLISASVIAIGTSLPELAVNVSSVLKKNTDLAVGNIIGSNILNIFWVLGITMFVHPIKSVGNMGFDIAIVFFSTLLLFVLMFIGKRHTLTRKEGILFAVLYAFYLIYLLLRY